jgi:hypothetical protein
MKKCSKCKKDKDTEEFHKSKSEEVRALLCPQCNHGLGNFKDNPELLVKAIHYLKTK